MNPNKLQETNEENLDKVFLSYSNFKYDILQLVKKLGDKKFDAIIGISRGGLTMTHFLSEYLDLRDVFVISAISYDGMKQLDEVEILNLPEFKKDYKRILVVDEIVDSGKTIKKILEVLREKYPKIEFLFATIFTKSSAIQQPDYFIHKTDKWIDFFWSKDLEEFKK